MQQKVLKEMERLLKGGDDRAFHFNYIPKKDSSLIAVQKALGVKAVDIPKTRIKPVSHSYDQAQSQNEAPSIDQDILANFSKQRKNENVDVPDVETKTNQIKKNTS